MLKVLYICTHNRCRSILSEALTNYVTGDVIEAKSAGSKPVDQVHPLTLFYLEQQGISTGGLHSKSWHTAQSFQPDIVITLCDTASGELCPMWMQQAVCLHWALSDPSVATGENEQRQAFAECMTIIQQRVQVLKRIALLGKDKKTLTDAFATLPDALLLPSDWRNPALT
ncbi:arsenate reductase ArsC [Neptunicella marina]|uniref:Arsenate reductase ArsC n=1 Tax=Neptunicella marina TaxID=2125989 RepID=A0A8J6IX08_9ALTE|nr:arsenate reductase ArsC [Neptunicella marina]MBC3766918.1 arsenate reductase ArsC [Neptunicella marina]